MPDGSKVNDALRTLRKELGAHTLVLQIVGGEYEGQAFSGCPCGLKVAEARALVAIDRMKTLAAEQSRRIAEAN